MRIGWLLRRQVDDRTRPLKLALNLTTVQLGHGIRIQPMKAGRHFPADLAEAILEG